jgi:hypothetical protein
MVGRDVNIWAEYAKFVSHSPQQGKAFFGVFKLGLQDGYDLFPRFRWNNQLEGGGPCTRILIWGRSNIAAVRAQTNEGDY